VAFTFPIVKLLLREGSDDATAGIHDLPGMVSHAVVLTFGVRCYEEVGVQTGVNKGEAGPHIFIENAELFA